jgi:hypothetical protein
MDPPPRHPCQAIRDSAARAPVISFTDGETPDYEMPDHEMPLLHGSSRPDRGTLPRVAALTSAQSGSVRSSSLTESQHSQTRTVTNLRRIVSARSIWSDDQEL